jgi:hypothetical protein
MLQVNAMRVTDYPDLQGVVEACDVAVRVASQLRVWEKSKRLSDRQAAEAAVRFLEMARNGGQLLAGNQNNISKLVGSLGPLNWATDTYLVTSAGSRPNNVNYEKVSKYLQGIVDTLQQLLADHKPSEASMADARRFFETLGELLGARADRMLMRDSSSNAIMAGAV